MVQRQRRKLQALEIAKHLTHQLPAPNLAQKLHAQQVMQHQVVLALLDPADEKRV
jgi:hypothetical protein